MCRTDMSYVVQLYREIGRIVTSLVLYDKLGLGWEKSKLSRYDIRAEGALTAQYNCDNESTKYGLLNLQCFSERINSK